MLWAAPLGSSAEWTESANVVPARSAVAAERRIFRIDHSLRYVGQTQSGGVDRRFQQRRGSFVDEMVAARKLGPPRHDLVRGYPDDRDQSSICCVRSSTGLISAAWTSSPRYSIGFVSAGRCCFISSLAIPGIWSYRRAHTRCFTM